MFSEDQGQGQIDVTLPVERIERHGFFGQFERLSHRRVAIIDPSLQCISKPVSAEPREASNIVRFAAQCFFDQRHLGTV